MPISQELMMGYAQTPSAGCSECQDLRKECSAALGEYLRILAERNAARKRRDHDLVEAFEEIENESQERCRNAQQAILDHESMHILDYNANSAEGIETTELLSR
jgi:thymidylate kinase